MFLITVVARFDIALLCSEEPAEPARADFLAQRSINSNEGFRALLAGLKPSQPILQNAPWHYKLSTVLEKFGLNGIDIPQDLDNALRKYDLVSESHSKLKLEAEAREQLVIDLSLSKDVVSPWPCAQPKNDQLDALENMSRAAEAMSLADEPGPVHLGYLRPKKDIAGSRLSSRKQNRSSSPQTLNAPLGVRLLLKEWDIGGDPHDYTYEDPYDESYDENPVRHPKTTEKSTQATKSLQAAAPVQSHRPPLVVSSRSLIPPFASLAEVPVQGGLGSLPSTTTLFRTGSQAAIQKQGNEPSSQEFVTSTQVLPGPYGGRQQAKKKPAKKRLGGF